MQTTQQQAAVAKVVKAYRHGIIDRAEAVECLVRVHGLTAEQAEAAVAE
jgi:hypothetical protein